MRILFVCTANRCRSPMAAALLSAQLDERSQTTVSSAGLGPPGEPAVSDAVDVLKDRGIDLRSHRSQQLSPALLEEADLVATMTRQHVVDLVVLDPPSWPKTFVLVDLVRRARQAGPPMGTETPTDWVSRLHVGRRREDLLRLPVTVDIPDPLGRPLAAFEETRDRLAGLVSVLADLLADTRWP